MRLEPREQQKIKDLIERAGAGKAAAQLGVTKDALYRAALGLRLYRKVLEQARRWIYRA